MAMGWKVCIKLGGRFAAGKFAGGSWPWRVVRWVEWVTVVVVGRMAHVQCVQHNVWYNLCSYTMMRSIVVSDSGNT